MSRVCSRQLIATVFKIHVSLQSEFVSPPSQTIFRRRGERRGGQCEPKQRKSKYILSRHVGRTPVQVRTRRRREGGSVHHRSKRCQTRSSSAAGWRRSTSGIRRTRGLGLFNVRIEGRGRKEGEQSYTRITKGINQHTFPACTSSLNKQRTHRKQSYI